MRLRITIQLERYIAHPYPPEKTLVINMAKETKYAMLGEAKRAKALAAWLAKKGISQAEWSRIQEESQKQWHKNGEGKIIIPAGRFLSALAATIDNNPKNARCGFDLQNTRGKIKATDFVCEKTEADGVFTRPVRLDKSNQRSEQSNEYIVNAVFVGELDVPIMPNKVDDFSRILSTMVEDTGIGAARKMGYGRGTIREIKVA